MRLLAGGGLAFALATLAGGVATGPTPAQGTPVRPVGAGSASPASRPLYGITGPPAAQLVRVDPATLRRLPGWRIPLDGHSFGWRGPDSAGALAGPGPTGGHRLRRPRQHRPRRGQAEWTTPAGLNLIDTRTWSVRTLDPRVTNAVLAARTLLGFGILWDSRIHHVAKQEPPELYS